MLQIIAVIVVIVVLGKVFSFLELLDDFFPASPADCYCHHHIYRFLVLFHPRCCGCIHHL